LKIFVADSLADNLKAFLTAMVKVENIKVDDWQTVDTLISEEALLFAKYLRNIRQNCNPRIVELRLGVFGKTSCFSPF
jgi:hypothetical protein